MMQRPAVLLLGLILAAGISWSALTFPVRAQSTYIEPGGEAPGGSVAVPLNSSDSSQQKTGSLIIGNDGDTKKLCLNADPVLGVNDPDNCVSGWGDFEQVIGGPFVNLQRGALLEADALTISAYLREPGFARIQSTTGQSFSAIIQTEPICDFALGLCRNKPTLACSTNNDCRGGLPTVSTGLYAAARVGSSDAAYFGGRVLIDRNARGDIGLFCLNDTGGPGCISSWDALAQPAFGYVRLQTVTMAQAIHPSVKQDGNAAVTGVGQISAIIAGDPELLSAANQGFTCGDGQCALYETAISCPIDCAVVNGLSEFDVSYNGPSNSFAVRTTAQSPAGNVQLLIVRSTGEPVNFTPQFGRLYTAPMTIGNTDIVYAGSVPQNSQINGLQDTGLNPAESYYYTAFQANQFPRYTSGLSDDTRFTLTVWTGGTSFNSVTGPGINCGQDCTEKFNHGEQVLIQLDLLDACWDFVGWVGGGCSGTNPSCTVTMTGDTFVSAGFIEKLNCSGGGGGGTE